MALLPLAAQLSFSALVRWPLLVNAAVLAGAVALAAATSVGGDAVLATALPAVGLTGITTACLQAGTFALASPFPPAYIQASVNLALAGYALCTLPWPRSSCDMLLPSGS